MPALYRTLLESVYTEAVAAVTAAKEELKEAEMSTMRADTKLVNARAHLSTVVKVMKASEHDEAEKADDSDKAAFKEMTDAIQTIQLYAIRNGISLGPTMDALTQRLFSTERVEA
jgi:hypothetical protein